jgi:hypothetical protein
MLAVVEVPGDQQVEQKPQVDLVVAATVLGMNLPLLQVPQIQVEEEELLGLTIQQVRVEPVVLVL